MAAPAPLQYLTVAPRTRHSATIILVHGLGDSGNGMKVIADQCRGDDTLSHVKWILPNAPTRSVTANMGHTMPSWFDIISFGFNCPEDEAGMLETLRSLQELIATEVNAGIPASRIVLGGFSQGGAMSILTGLCGDRKLAGVIALSGWLPLNDKFAEMAKDHARTTPVFFGHGVDDPLVTIQMGRMSENFLRNSVRLPRATDADVRGVTFKEYEGMQHQTCPKELDDMKGWLVKVIPKTT